jgi:hypothetical protein
MQTFSHEVKVWRIKRKNSKNFEVKVLKQLAMKPSILSVHNFFISHTDQELSKDKNL